MSASPGTSVVPTTPKEVPMQYVIVLIILLLAARGYFG